MAGKTLPPLPGTRKSLLLVSNYESEQVRILDIEGHAINKDLIILRDKKLQQDRPRFREALENIGYDIGREITKELIREDYLTVEVETCLGFADQLAYGREPVLLNILRASNPMWYGMQRAFPQADTGFVGASRVHGDVKGDGSLGVSIDYESVPNIRGERLIIVDPMLATGSSIIDIYNQICAFQGGKPSRTFIASAIAASGGIERILNNIPDSRIITASRDKKLNKIGYIIPGLGDAGDLCFGEKYEE